MAEAIQDYIRAVTIRPTMAEGHANLASAYKDRLVYIPSNISHFLSLPCCMTLHAMAYFDAFIL